MALLTSGVFERAGCMASASSVTGPAVVLTPVIGFVGFAL